MTTTFKKNSGLEWAYTEEYFEIIITMQTKGWLVCINVYEPPGEPCEPGECDFGVPGGCSGVCAYTERQDGGNEIFSNDDGIDEGSFCQIQSYVKSVIKAKLDYVDRHKKIICDDWVLIDERH